MKRAWRLVARVAKVLITAAAAAAIRISKGEGQGVFEQAMQTAAAEMAARYLRIVNP